MSATITAGVKVLVTKGCRALDITKGLTAIVVDVMPLGADYGHTVKVTLRFLNGFIAGKTKSLTARHVNRLADTEVSLKGLRPTEGILVQVKRGTT